MRVVVAGGGVIGRSVAWRCARRGLEVVLHDPEPERSASFVAAGMLAPVNETVHGEEDVLALNLESARRWPRFAAELAADSGLDPGYLRCGTLAVARDGDDMAALDWLAVYQAELGLAVERLGRREVRRREPALGPGVVGGLLAPDDHQVENRRLLTALGAALDRHGVERVDRPLASVAAAGDATVVVAAGWQSSDLVPGLPVRPVKGQIVRLGARPTSVLPAHVLFGRDAYVAPRFGEIVVGATVEEQGADRTVTAGAVQDLLRAAWELVPGIAEAELVECAAGLRPAAPDNRPLIGAVDDTVVVATGHHRHGILLAPVTADAVLMLIDTGCVDDVVAPFGADRFGVPAW